MTTTYRSSVHSNELQVISDRKTGLAAETAMRCIFHRLTCNLSIKHEIDKSETKKRANLSLQNRLDLLYKPTSISRCPDRRDLWGVEPKMFQDMTKDIRFRNPLTLAKEVRRKVEGDGLQHYLFIDEIQMSLKIKDPYNEKWFANNILRLPERPTDTGQPRHLCDRK